MRTIQWWLVCNHATLRKTKIYISKLYESWKDFVLIDFHSISSNLDISDQIHSSI